jgi:hypothetical protein
MEGVLITSNDSSKKNPTIRHPLRLTSYWMKKHAQIHMQGNLTNRLGWACMLTKLVYSLIHSDSKTPMNTTLHKWQQQQLH